MALQKPSTTFTWALHLLVDILISSDLRDSSRLQTFSVIRTGLIKKTQSAIDYVADMPMWQGVNGITEGKKWVIPHSIQLD